MKAKVKTSDGTEFVYTLQSYYWHCDSGNAAVFRHLGIDPKEHCAKYYKNSLGEWPQPSYYIRTPGKVRKLLIAAMRGLEQYDCEVSLEFDAEELEARFTLDRFFRI